MLTLIDNNWMKKCVYFLKHKSKVLNMFKKFKALIKKQFNKQIKQ